MFGDDDEHWAPQDDEVAWGSWLRLAGLIFVFGVVAVVMLACMFGCMVYNW